VRIDPNLTRIGLGPGAAKVDAQRPTEGTTGGREQPSRIGGADEMILTPRAQEMQVARRALDATPQVRQDQVDALRKQIANGTFKVDAAAVVDKLLKGGL
jgi:flagellar biosynthesis anti-sigma factor FlgM